jgi:anti-sigma factor RsiW
MADEFDRILGEALAPDAREADRLFVARVQARVALDERLRAERRSAFRQLGMEVIALGAVAAALLWLMRAAPVAGFFAESPEIALTLLLSVFALLVVLFSRQTVEQSARKVELPPISNA